VFILPEPAKFLQSNDIQLVIYIVIGVMSVGFFYFNYFFALPKYFFKRQYWRYAISVIVFVLMTLFLTKLIVQLGFSEANMPGPEKPELYINYFTRFILILIISIGVRLNFRLRQAQSDKIKAELASLKAQINPHFLFNILNDIYGQAITKSEHTADSIAKLASMMRHVLTEVNEDLIGLEKEVKYLKSYVELQKMRVTDKTKVRFEVDGNIGSQQIPPLLFINFVENAFKYGVSNEVESTITILLSTQTDSVSLKVKNEKVFAKNDKDDSHNIGIENTKRRLDLIFGNRYSLDINDKDKTFEVNLKLNLK
jgi:sensor histidine kinase YesM